MLWRATEIYMSCSMTVNEHLTASYWLNGKQWKTGINMFILRRLLRQFFIQPYMLFVFDTPVRLVSHGRIIYQEASCRRRPWTTYHVIITSQKHVILTIDIQKL